MDADMNRMFQLVLERLDKIDQESVKTNSRLDKLEQEVTKLNIRQENEIIPQIKLLAEGQSVLPQMAKDIEKIKDKQEGMEIKLDALSEVVPQHSESIRELKKKAL